MSKALYARFPELQSFGTPTDPATGEPFSHGIHWASGRRFLTGARRSPPHRLAAATPHRATALVPGQVAYCPAQLNAWGNATYGDCVTAEEAYAKATYGLDGQGHVTAPEIFISEDEVINWARSNGYLNGADLSSVIESMEQSGFQVGSQLYNDGPYNSVDWSTEAVLQSAIAQGPVKIAIASSVLPSGAGNQQGWFITGNQGGINRTDHCVSLGGFGPAGWLFEQLNAVYGNVALPSGLSPTTPGYLLYTWATIGFVDHAWIMGTVPEAWLRTPTTVGLPPLTPPSPTPPSPTPPGPTPPTPPTPPVGADTLTVAAPIPKGSWLIGSPTAPVGTLITEGGIPAGAYPVNLPPT